MKARAAMSDGGVDAGPHGRHQHVQPGVTFSAREIAFVCGCSRQLIYQIEWRALRRLRAAYERRGVLAA